MKKSIESASKPVMRIGREVTRTDAKPARKESGTPAGKTELEEKSKLLKNIESQEDIRLVQAKHHKDLLIEAKDLVLHYGEKEVCRGISFELHQGDCLVLEGHNGCGKSSIIKAVLQGSRRKKRAGGNTDSEEKKRARGSKSSRKNSRGSGNRGNGEDSGNRGNKGNGENSGNRGKTGAGKWAEDFLCITGHLLPAGESAGLHSSGKDR